MMLSRESTLSLADIARVSRVKRRTIQLWADVGVLRALPSTMLRGSGVHRRFTTSELKLAQTLRSFHDQAIAIAIGMIKEIADRIRREFQRGGQDKKYVVIAWQHAVPLAILIDDLHQPDIISQFDSVTIVPIG